MLSIRPNLTSSRSATGAFSSSHLNLPQETTEKTDGEGLSHHLLLRVGTYCETPWTSSSSSSSSSSSNIHTARQRFPICAAYNNNNSNKKKSSDSVITKKKMTILMNQCRPGGRIESDAIQRNVRDLVINAIDQSRSRRVTAGDVASSSGIQLFDATQALTALAADTNASLEVTNDGDLVYAFPSGYKQLLQAVISS